MSKKSTKHTKPAKLIKLSRKQRLALYNDNLGLAYKMSNCARYFNSCVTSKEDLHQESLTALWIAVNTFDSSRNIKFSTYACNVIKNRLFNYYDHRTNHYRNLPNNHIPINIYVKPFDESGNQCSQTLEYKAANVKAKNDDNYYIYDILGSLYSGEDLLIMIDCYHGYKVTELYDKYGDKGFAKFYYRFKHLRNKIREYYEKDGIIIQDT